VQELSPYTIERVGPAPPPDYRRRLVLADEHKLRGYWLVVLKHLRLIGGLFLAITALAAVWVVTATRQYTAKATVLIEPKLPEVLDIHQLLSENSGGEERDYYRTQYDILASRSLAAEVIKALGPSFTQTLAAPPPGFLGQGYAWVRGHLPAGAHPEDSEILGVRSDLIDAYLSHLSIRPEIGTRLVVVSFTCTSPGLAAKVTDAHVDAYIRRGVELHMQQSKAAREFLEQKVSELRDRVESSEAALNAYRRDRGIVAFSLQDKGATLMQQLKELSTDLTKATTDRITLEAHQQLIRHGEYEALPEVISDPLIQNLKETVGQLAAQYASLSNRYNPGYHPLDDLRAKYLESQARLNREIRGVAEGVEANYRGAIAAESKIQAEIDRVKTDAGKLNDASLKDAILSRDYETNQTLYKDVLKRMDELGMSADLPTSNVSVVDYAETPRHPSSPRPLLTLALAGTSALILGLGLAFLLDSLDDRLRTPEEVEQFLQLPSLGVIPDLAKVWATGYGQPYGYGGGNGRTVRPAQNRAAAKDILISNSSPGTEVYRTVRSAVMFSRAGGAPRTILIASASPGEGKTLTSVNLAMAFSYVGPAILIDADMRRPRCHRVLGIVNRIGLSEVLVGQSTIKAAISATEHPRLSLLTAGSRSPNPGELLASPQMGEVLEQLKSDYTYIFIDSPPLMAVGDSLALATIADGVILVAGAHVSRSLVMMACNRLHDVGAKILGVVQNRVDPSDPFSSRSYRGYAQYYGNDENPLDEPDESDTVSTPGR